MNALKCHLYIYIYKWCRRRRRRQSSNHALDEWRRDRMLDYGCIHDSHKMFAQIPHPLNTPFEQIDTERAERYGMEFSFVRACHCATQILFVWWLTPIATTSVMEWTIFFCPHLRRMTRVSVWFSAGFTCWWCQTVFVMWRSHVCMSIVRVYTVYVMRLCFGLEMDEALLVEAVCGAKDQW